MYRLVVLGQEFSILAYVAEPLIAQDILYWDTEDHEEGDHLHLNPEHPAFDAMEALALAIAGVEHPGR